MKPEKQLYQWDVNQYLTGINPAAQYVDYTIDNEVIRLETDGTRCRIPDEILQTYGGKTCYERYPDGTYRAYSFTVLYAPKPPDYVFTPEERTTFEALTARVDASIEEIKRRADSGEFTPVKGVDYFTESDKNELMEGVSSGAVGEFRKVVDSATTEYNANATEKLATYDTNAEQHTTDYNRNAAEKLEAYNQNHAEKVAEYNQNAENKKAEFDSNAAALQTEVDRLRGECDQLAEENRKQENRISALLKLNKGQTYDIVPEEGESASRTAPSGSKYVSVDKVGGKSIVWNQLINYSRLENWANEYSVNGATITATTNRASTRMTIVLLIDRIVANHKYLFKSNNLTYSYNGSGSYSSRRIVLCDGWESRGEIHNNKGIIAADSDGTQSTLRALIEVTFTQATAIGDTLSVDDVQLFDLTQMFGSTIADYIYSLEQSQAGAGVAWFKKLFPKDYYPYSEPTIISSQTDMVDVASADGTLTQKITTGFPELKSAGTAHDVIDMDGGTIQRNVGTVDLGTLAWDYNCTFEDGNVQFIARVPGRAYTTNGLCDKFEKSEDNALGTYTLRTTGDQITFTAPEGTKTHSFVESMSGATLYYELATPTTEPVTIPEALTEWLPVEAGGTITFRNADESKQLPVPNSVSWVRKLNEVE